MLNTPLASRPRPAAQLDPAPPDEPQARPQPAGRTPAGQAPGDVPHRRIRSDAADHPQAEPPMILNRRNDRHQAGKK